MTDKLPTTLKEAIETADGYLCEDGHSRLNKGNILDLGKQSALNRIAILKEEQKNLQNSYELNKNNLSEKIIIVQQEWENKGRIAELEKFLGLE